VTVQDGTSMCVRHRRQARGGASKPRGGQEACELCRQSGCGQIAWCVLDALPLCIRHTVEAVHPDDDMRVHDMAHSLYLHLQAQGEPDRY
jgi:hypothetical protein